MKYREKINKAKEIVELLKSGSSVEQIKTDLSKERISKIHISNILKSTNSIIFDEYVEQVSTHLLEENLEDNLDNFNLVDADTFEKIQLSALKKINSKTNSQVNSLLKEHKTREEIWQAIDNPYYTEELLEKQIDKFNYYNKPVDGLTKTSRQLGGVGLIIAGIVLSLMLSDQKKSYYFYGLVIAGIFCRNAEFIKKLKFNRYHQYVRI